MLKKMAVMVSLLCPLLLVAERVGESHRVPAECMPIKEACERAGFHEGGVKEGKGTWHNCVFRIMQGNVADSTATLPLPQVPDQVIQNCKSKYPNFGHGRIGSKK